MSSSPLKDFLTSHKDYIIQKVKDDMGALPRSPYLEFMFGTEEGHRRFTVWVDFLIRAALGKPNTFFTDQERVGYYRAVQGFKLEDVSNVYRIFYKVFWELLQKSSSIEENANLPNLLKEIEQLNNILFQGFYIVANSFLRTREEQITEKVNQLKILYEFTHEIINIFELNEIVNLILSRMVSLFEVEASVIALCRNNETPEIYGNTLEQETRTFQPIIEKSWREKQIFFMDEEGDISKDVAQYLLKRLVSVPIHAHGRFYGILILFNKMKGFKFTEKELSLLFQFIYIISVALENVFILEEINLNRQELRLLANKIITIQEEERKRLAADIHDNLAQSLTGISYKIQLCKELIKKSPGLLDDQLDNILKTINHTIDQTRTMISNLRPHLIDTMGFVPALKRQIEDFTQETGIKVIANLPKRVNLSSQMSICLFRVAQEALMNVYKHAEAMTVQVSLQKKDGDIILVVADDGKGFDMSKGTFLTKNQNTLGLLSMRERLEAIGGRLVIHSEISQGCRIEAKIPLKI